MEAWEKDLREKLEISVPRGLHNIGTDKFVCMTGKKGYINFRVSLSRAARNYGT